MSKNECENCGGYAPNNMALCEKCHEEVEGPVGEIGKLLKRRSDAVEKLIRAFDGLTMTQQISIITSFIPISELEELADFQDRKS